MKVCQSEWSLSKHRRQLRSGALEVICLKIMLKLIRNVQPGFILTLDTATCTKKYTVDHKMGNTYKYRFNVGLKGLNYIMLLLP